MSNELILVGIHVSDTKPLIRLQAAFFLCSLVLLSACKFDASVKVGASAIDGGDTDGLTTNQGDAALFDAALIDAALIDAAPADAIPCPDFCASCNSVSMSCEVNCLGNNCPNGTNIICPAGWKCLIGCIGTGACQDGAVTCSGDCEISCVGTGACESAPVSCSGTSCTVLCSGTDSCDNAVRCNASSCDISCIGTGACEDEGVCCSGVDCGGQCFSQAGGNCNCPSG